MTTDVDLLLENNRTESEGTKAERRKNYAFMRKLILMIVSFLITLTLIILGDNSFKTLHLVKEIAYQVINFNSTQ